MVDKLLTTKEVIGILRISKPSFYRLLASGEMPTGMLIGRSRRWPETAIKDLLAEKFRKANSGKGAGK